MNKRIIWAALILIVAEALVISGFIVFWPKDANRDIMIVDIVVSSIMLATIFGIDMFKPLVDLNSDQPKQVGSLGVRWFVSGAYFVLALILMIFWGQDGKYSLNIYILLHAILLFLLICGIIAAVRTGNKVTEIAEIERTKLKGREYMRKSIRKIKDEIAINQELPQYFIAEINDIEDRLRYISPSSNPDATELENNFEDVADSIRFALTNFKMNEDAIKKNLLRLNRILENRKNIYK